MPQSASRTPRRAHSRIERRSNDLPYTVAAVVIAVVALAAALLAPRWLPAHWFVQDGIEIPAPPPASPKPQAPSLLPHPAPPGGRTPQDAPPMPEIIDARQAAEITSLYHSAAVRIGGTLGRAIQGLAAEPESNRDRVRRARSASMLREIDGHLARLGAAARPRIDAASERVVARAKTFADAEMRRVGVRTAARAEGGRPEVASGGVSVADGSGAELDLLGSPDDASVRLLARDIVAMTENGAADLRNSAERVFRSLQAVDLSGTAIDGRPVADALARLFIEGDPRGADRALRELFRDREAPELESMRKLGNRQITVGGWTGEVRAYTATVLRTRSAEAANARAIEQFVEADLDLGQIEGNNTTNFCTRFLGLIVALTPEAARRTGHPPLASLPGGGPPFHPNCSKLVEAFVEDVSPESDAKRGEAAARRYEGALRAGTLTDNLKEPLRSA